MCKDMTTVIQKKVIDSLVCITQYCNNCQHKHIWESQPYIRNVPAGNMMTSAAILYTSSLPSKALRIFKILNCASISLPTFLHHQSSYLLPAISSVWIYHQEKLLSKFKESKVNLQVGGDGRADNPGHSAKYGTYSLIELTCNKVVDFQLVQVCTILKTFILNIF